MILALDTRRPNHRPGIWALLAAKLNSFAKESGLVQQAVKHVSPEGFLVAMLEASQAALVLLLDIGLPQPPPPMITKMSRSWISKLRSCITTSVPYAIVRPRTVTLAADGWDVGSLARYREG